MIYGLNGLILFHLSVRNNKEMDNLIKRYSELELDPFYVELSELIDAKQNQVIEYANTKGKSGKLFHELPGDIVPSGINLNADWIRIGEKNDLNEFQYEQLDKLLRDLHPWRKGPFDVFGIKVDAEWASYIKWNRVKDHIEPLAGRRILDIGSSSGYYMFKMAGQSPEMVLGIEPYLQYYLQYQVLQYFIQLNDIFCIPAKLEEMPVLEEYFDTIFCMGILYHRKSPIDTLRQIHDNMRKGGELVLETLVIEGESELALFPRDRYTKMRNIYFIPTVRCLTFWLERAGFENIRCIDTSPTTLIEQRKTEWIKTESLADFLDPDDPGKTVEGYPAPIRSVLLANVK